jgi:magnesium-transporting ATPase (P-type)
MGELLKVYKDEEFPADMILLKSSKESGMAYVDTMNLDGETNLKERTSPKELQVLKDEDIHQLDGELICDSPNESLEKWDGNITSTQLPKAINVGLKQLLMRGCKLRNTDYVLGFVVYVGLESKVMMN